MDAADRDAAAAKIDEVRLRRRYEGPRPPLKASDACSGTFAEKSTCEEVLAATGQPPYRGTISLNDVISIVTVAPPEPAPATPANKPGEERPYECPPVPGSATPPTVEADKVVTVKEIEARLKAYAKSLTAITNSSDRTALYNAFTDLSKSVSGLVTTVGLAGGGVGAAAGAIAAPAVSLVGRIIGGVEDRQRLEALTIALTITCKPMKVISYTVNLLLQDRFTVIAKSRNESLNALFNGRAGISAVEDEARDKQITDIITRGTKLPGRNFSTGLEMGKAHDALVKAVINREGQTKALLDALGHFADSVSELETAISKPSSTKTTASTS
jgi:hypothetical protein